MTSADHTDQAIADLAEQVAVLAGRISVLTGRVTKLDKELRWNGGRQAIVAEDVHRLRDSMRDLTTAVTVINRREDPGPEPEPRRRASRPQRRSHLRPVKGGK